MHRPKLGWHRELPDLRDYAISNRPDSHRLVEESQPITLFGMSFSRKKTSYVDLSTHCSPIEDQGNIGSCTAQAGIGLIEYMERRGRGVHVDASRLFLYKVTRNMLGWVGDTGAYVRTTLQAMTKFGVCPEMNWPYNTEDFDKEPPAFCYAFAQSAKSLSYYRIDETHLSWEKTLKNIKALLRVGVPSMFGFTVYHFGDSDGDIYMPDSYNDTVYGGHAVMAVGYDDDRDTGDTKGALKIRNSWGTGWGDKGYGWLPYDYVLHGLTSDWWCVFSQDYLGD